MSSFSSSFCSSRSPALYCFVQQVFWCLTLPPLSTSARFISQYCSPILILLGGCFSWKRTARELPYTWEEFRACSYKARSTRSHPSLRVALLLRSPSPLLPHCRPAPSRPCPRPQNSFPSIVRRARYCWVVVSPGKEPPVRYPTRRRDSVLVLTRHMVQDPTLPSE